MLRTQRAHSIIGARRAEMPRRPTIALSLRWTIQDGHLTSRWCAVEAGAIPDLQRRRHAA
jgi:hypothetical protein